MVYVVTCQNYTSWLQHLVNDDFFICVHVCFSLLQNSMLKSKENKLAPKTYILKGDTESGENWLHCICIMYDYIIMPFKIHIIVISLSLMDYAGGLCACNRWKDCIEIFKITLYISPCLLPAKATV